MYGVHEAINDYVNSIVGEQDEPEYEGLLPRKWRESVMHGWTEFVVNQYAPFGTNIGAKKDGRVDRDVHIHSYPDWELRADIYRPEESENLPVLLSMHGGGWVYGRKGNLERLGRSFARRGFVVVNLEYRLAPRFRYPACIEDVFVTLHWIEHHIKRYGGDPSRIGVYGDSAGGHLTAMAANYPRVIHSIKGMHSEAYAFKSGVKAAIPYYGVFDFLNFAKWKSSPAKFFSRSFLGHIDSDGGRRRYESASPINYLHRDTPPMLLMVGTLDPLLKQSKKYHKALKGLGAPVELQLYAGEPHVFMNLWWRKNSKQAFFNSLEFFSKHLKA